MPIDTQYILEFLRNYELIAVFFGAFFFGETVVISAGFLAGQELWSITSVFFVALIATVVADTIWFLGGIRLLYSKRFKRYKKRYEQGISKVEKYLPTKQPFLILLFIKFLYGTRILTIIYLSHKRLSFWLFVLFDTIGTALWLIVMLGAGYFAGKGIGQALNIVNQFEKGLLSLLLVIIAYKLISSWIEKRFLNK